MHNLFQYSQSNPHLTPAAALHQLVATYQQPQSGNIGLPIGMNPGQQPPGTRTPGLQNAGNHFASPATGHLNLPGSPHIGVGGTQHTPSPAQHHMQAPGLAAQHSQQGTNSSQGTSANTSPNVTNKRRRASAVKAEGDDHTGEQVNGTSAKVKASPRPGGKRQKPNQS
jgi:hypothetical protein